MRDLGLATVNILGLKGQEKETVLLEPIWKLDPWKKDQLTEAVATEKATIVKTSLQQEGSQGNKYPDMFLLLRSPAKSPVDKTKWQPGKRELSDTIHKCQHFREWRKA